MSTAKASICLSTFNRPQYLERVLDSIVCQRPPFEYEIVVVDDGSPDIDTESICCRYDEVRYYRINRRPVYRNPAKARNMAYDAAKGDVLILQSDDVLHQANAIEKLVELLQEGSFVISTVFNVDWNDTSKKIGTHGGRWFQYTGPVIDKAYSPNPLRPLFFLGSVFKKDVLSVGGCDEDFTEPGREDVWFGECLMNGAHLKPLYTREVVGLHLHHERLQDLHMKTAISMTTYKEKVKQAQKTGIWKAAKGIGLSAGR